MALSTVADTAKLEIKQLLHGRFLENVLHFRNEIDGVSLTTMAILGEAVHDWWLGEMAAAFSTGLTVTGLFITSEDLGEPFELDYSTGFPVSGAESNPAIAVNVACETQFGTGLIGRYNRGRAYQSGLSEAVVTGNTVDSASVALIQAGWYELAPTYLTGTNWFHVVVSRQRDRVTIDPAVAVDIITYETQHQVHDMGRRLDN